MAIRVSGLGILFLWQSFLGPSYTAESEPRHTAQTPQTYYVDDDAPNDPGPNDPSVGDPLENGSAEHPFDRIQEGLDLALPEDTVQILPGIFAEDLQIPIWGCKVVGSGNSATSVQSVSAWLITPSLTSDVRVII